MVPVVSCHAVQEGQKMVRRVLSFVRLKALDECSRGLRDATQRTGLLFPFAGSVGDLHEPLGSAFGHDWEGVVFSRLLMVRLDECPDEVLKGGSSVVQALSDQDATDRGKRLSVFDVSHVPAGLEIDIDPDFEGFAVRDSSKFVVEGAQAFICPVELGFDPFKCLARAANGEALE